MKVTYTEKQTPIHLAHLLALGLLPAALGCRSEPAASEPPTEVFEITDVTVEPPAPVQPTEPVEPGIIDLAICLDTSGSMDGLIESAKQKLWSIVNDFALVEPVPTLRVALLTFGNDGHQEENGWVRIDAPLTGDLDLISQRLFELTTNGGTEYVGRVVSAATTDLEWSTSPAALKLLVVAGNESADQDPLFGFREASRNAIAAGIMVNAIYCGDLMDDLAPAWREVSLLADGQFASIDANNGTVVINTPFDEELQALTTSVNTTYIPLGRQGRDGWANQRVQDSNNWNLNGEAAASRAMSKNGALYVCGWDLVDACRVGTMKIEEVKKEDLPEELQLLTTVELTKYVETKAEERKQIQLKVTEVGVKREAWLATERARMSLDESKAFDRVLRDAMRKQAITKGFKFKQVATPEVSPETAPTTEEEPPATVQEN